MDEKQTGIRVEVPGSEPLVLARLLLDFSGTLSCDGVLLPGVAQRLEALGQKWRITVLTVDTFGSAARQLEGLPAELQRIQTGLDKVDFLARLNSSETPPSVMASTTSAWSRGRHWVWRSSAPKAALPN